MSDTLVEYGDAVLVYHPMIHGRFLSKGHTFYRTDDAFLQFTVSRCGFLSQADASSTEDDDGDGDNDDDHMEVEDQLTELDADGDSIESETCLLDCVEDGEKPEYELELLDTKSVPAEKKSRSAKSQSELFKVVVNVSGLSVDSALNKWVARGKELSRKEIWLALVNLRKRKMYGKALLVDRYTSIFGTQAPLYSSFCCAIGQNRWLWLYSISKITPFHSLPQAYKNAKHLANGIRERMKADNVFPNRALSDQFAEVDPFRKTPVSNLLD
ncbi:unnamed protein product [Vicia faba]|uniref:Uncharacterized protein n=1 Tax=Vicia faba TaxID=3906 RepID=A0AAV1BB54_VICFA|nr:unnamed protein product [Vicia faba]